MSILDVGIIIGYLVLLLYVGGKLGRGNKTQEDYFIAGRMMGWLPVALSIAATTISGNGLIGGPGWSYQSGMKAFMLNASIPLVMAMVCGVFLPFLYQMKITSCYEYLGKRLGVKTRSLGAAGFLLTALIQVSSMVYIPSLIIGELTGWDIKIILALIVIIATVYTLLGGIRAVIWTDAIQMVVVWGSLIAIIFAALHNLDMGFWDTIRAAQEAGKLQALDFSFNLQTENGFFVTLLGGGILWMQYYMADQSQVQRMFATKSVAEVKRSLLVSGILMNVMYFVFMLIGFQMFSVFGGREFESANQVMIQFIAEYIPTGVLGCIIAGVFAAAMSSVDSLLNSMATVFVKDIYEEWILKGKKEASLKVSRYFTLAMAVFVFVFAMFAFVDTTASILATVGSYISYLCGAILGIFFLGMFTEKANDFGASVGFVAGVGGTILLARLFSVNYLWYNVTGLIITLATGYLASLLKGEKRQEIQQYTMKGVKIQTDRYFWGLIVFFILQYAVLFLMQ